MRKKRSIQKPNKKTLETKQDKSTHGTHDDAGGKHGFNHLEQWACMQRRSAPSHGQLNRELEKSTIFETESAAGGAAASK
jgi:hypothetical protein